MLFENSSSVREPELISARGHGRMSPLPWCAWFVVLKYFFESNRLFECTRLIADARKGDGGQFRICRDVFLIEKD
jgi:hypothetical protein